MECYLCKGKADIQQQKGREICNECFCNQIEKRVRKYARINELFKKGDKIQIKGSVNKYLVKSMLKGMPVEISSKGTKKVIEWTMDDEANEFMKALFDGKKIKKDKKNEVKLLKVLTDEEVKMFAKIKNLKFIVKKKDEDVQAFLDNVEKKHPNIKYNLLKNIERLQLL